MQTNTQERINNVGLNPEPPLRPSVETRDSQEQGLCISDCYELAP